MKNNSTDFDPSEYIPLAEAARRLPGRLPGRHISSATLWRWVLKGKLPAVKIGGSYFVRPSDLAAMIDSTPASKPPDIPTCRQRKKLDKWVDETLRKHGLA